MIRTVGCMAMGVTLCAIVGHAQNPPAPQPAISRLVTAGTTVELVRGGFQGLEGPVSTPDGGMYFSDITANRTYKLEANGTISVWRENTKSANGL